jgi:hypothetical protein
MRVTLVSISTTRSAVKLFENRRRGDLLAAATLQRFGFDAEVLFIAKRLGYTAVEGARPLERRGRIEGGNAGGPERILRSAARGSGAIIRPGNMTSPDRSALTITSRNSPAPGKSATRIPEYFFQAPIIEDLLRLALSPVGHQRRLRI